MGDERNISRSRLICACCLSIKLPFIKLINCKHALSFVKILENKVDLAGICVCTLCHKMIMKIDNFKHQAEQCISNLNEGFEDLKRKTHCLKMSDVEINSTINNEPIEHEIKEHITLTVDIKPEATIDNNSYSESETCTPLTKTKKVKVKNRKVKVLRRRVPPYEGKIKIVTLSHDEMVEERKRESSKISYINLPFKCEDCITGFDHKLTLDIHKEQRHGYKEGAFVCEICKSVLSTETSMKEHQKRHTRRYECVECGQRRNNVHTLIKHYNDVHGAISTLYTCADCGFTTESHRKHRYHRDKHKAKPQCKECGNTFVSPTVLRAHMLTVHGQSDRVYICSVCGKKYRSKSSLVTHQALHNKPPSPDSFCVTCKTHFRSPTGLRHHLKTHSKHIRDSDKRFSCQECGLKMLSKALLQEHVDWVHLKKENHACNDCPKVFKNKSGLKKHINYVHDKKRPPRNKICDHCGHGFTTLQILRAHVRTHTGERPLSCARCPASFAHPAALYTHTKLLHAGNK